MAYFTEQRLLDSTPTTTVLTKIHDMMGDHAAWAHVEDWTDSTYTVRTYKCDSTVTGSGYDFYLHLSYTTAGAGTSQIFFQGSEGYDAANNLLIRGCGDPADTVTPDATYEAVAGNTGYAASSANWNRFMAGGVSTTDFTYWIVLTNTGFWFRSTTDNFGSHVGLFTPFWVHANEYPLWQFHVGNSDVDGGGSVSRRPSQAGVSMTDAFAVNSYNTANTQYSTMIGTVPNTGTLYDKSYGSRFVVYHSTATSDNGKVRGLAKDFLTFNTDAAVAVGDTIDIGSDTYVNLYDGTTVGYFVNWDAT